MPFETTIPVALILGAAILFWIGLLGLLWRRSLMGMLIGLLFGWLSVGLLGIGLSRFARGVEAESLGATGSVLVLCTSILGGLHVAIGLGIIVARIKRRGTLDADDAGLLEG